MMQWQELKNIDMVPKESGKCALVCRLSEDIGISIQGDAYIIPRISDLNIVAYIWDHPEIHSKGYKFYIFGHNSSVATEQKLLSRFTHVCVIVEPERSKRKDLCLHDDLIKLVEKHKMRCSEQER